MHKQTKVEFNLCQFLIAKLFVYSDRAHNKQPQGNMRRNKIHLYSAVLCLEFSFK